MTAWNNLDTLKSFEKLVSLKGKVNIAEAMAGESGAERVKTMNLPMAGGLTFNYAARQVDEEVLEALAGLAIAELGQAVGVVGHVAEARDERGVLVLVRGAEGVVVTSCGAGEDVDAVAVLAVGDLEAGLQAAVGSVRIVGPDGVVGGADVGAMVR